MAEKHEKILFMYVMEILLDMILINERQAKTGMGDVGLNMKDRSIVQPEKRIQNKLNQFKSLSITEFY